MIINHMLLLLIGLAGGLAVGGALVAFLTVLGIVPRLAQITKTYNYIYHYQYAIITGCVWWTWVGFGYLQLQWFSGWTLIYGLFAGIFVGLLAAALTEVLNVLPILAKRMNMTENIIWLLMAMVFGKVVGSLFHWVVFAGF